MNKNIRLMVSIEQGFDGDYHGDTGQIIPVTRVGFDEHQTGYAFETFDGDINGNLSYDNLGDEVSFEERHQEEGSFILYRLDLDRLKAKIIRSIDSDYMEQASDLMDMYNRALQAVPYENKFFALDYI